MISVLGEILFDELPGGRRPGGAPFNFAQHLQRLGRRVRFVSRIGCDEAGDALQTVVKESGLDPQNLQRDPDHATGRVQVRVDENGVPTYTIIENAAYDYIDFGAAAECDPELVYFGSLIQRTAGGRERLQSFLGSLPARTKRLYDMNLRPGCETEEIIRPSLEQTDILKINEDELAAGGRLLGLSETGTEALAGALMEQFNIAVIALTRGPDGSVLYRGGQRFEQTADTVGPEQIVDTVGAGDSFTAMLAHGLLSGLPAPEILQKASHLSEKVCTLAGAVPGDPDFYEPFRTAATGEST